MRGYLCVSFLESEIITEDTFALVKRYPPYYNNFKGGDNTC